MNIEERLRELMAVEDPGVQVTDAVMSRVGGRDVPGHSSANISRLSDARARRIRFIIASAVVAVAAAAGALMWYRGPPSSSGPPVAVALVTTTVAELALKPTAPTVPAAEPETEQVAPAMVKLPLVL
ncbi:MAG: hypothetical protein ABI645_11575, partial [Pseudomonadota bacterium]